MRLEIEITEDEIKSAIERKVRVAIADQTNGWSIDNVIKDKVKAAIPLAVDVLIADALSKSDNLKQRILDEMERQIKRRLQSALKIREQEGK